MISLTKLNWRQILIHFVAAWCFIGAFYFLAFLTNMRLFSALIGAKDLDVTTMLEKANITGTELMNYSTIISSSWLWGLLAAFCISIVLSIKKKGGLG